MAGGNTTLRRFDEYFIAKLCNHSTRARLKFGEWIGGKIGTRVKLFRLTLAIWKTQYGSWFKGGHYSQPNCGVLSVFRQSSLRSERLGKSAELHQSLGLS